MALSDNKTRYTMQDDKATVKNLPAASGVELFRGAIVSNNASGYAQEASSTTRCRGIAREYCKNASASAVTSSENGVVVEFGHIERFSKSTAAVSHIGKTVYAHADDTVSTSGSALHKLGTVVDVVVSTSWDIRILPDMT